MQPEDDGKMKHKWLRWRQTVRMAAGRPLVRLLLLFHFEGEGVNLICLSLSRNICGTAVSSCITLDRHGFMRTPARRHTDRDGDRDRHADNEVKFRPCFQPSIIFGPPLIKFPPLSRFPRLSCRCLRQEDLRLSQSVDGLVEVTVVSHVDGG